MENKEQIDVLNQFSRTELLLGHEGMEKLSKARVAGFGIGGPSRSEDTCREQIPF